MGIQGLLQALKPFTECVEISKYSGKRVGIDAYSWLHKGAYACSMELCEQRFNGVNGVLPLYVQYCMHRIKLLQHHNVTPVVVFDGGYLPQKAATETDRAKRRKQYLDQARSRLSAGDSSGAIESYQRAVEITPLMAYELIKILKQESVEFVVAPYEADSQLAFLARRNAAEGGVDAIISEDSDLLAYGCDVVIYKMDRFGSGEEIQLKRVLSSGGLGQGCLSFLRFTRYLFTGMCILAGCDFLASVPGIGLKKAHALVTKYKNLDRVISVLRCDIKVKLPEGYATEFQKAMALFLHARVYDSIKQELCYLSPLTEEALNGFREDLAFLGPDIPRSQIVAVAEGRLDPTTMREFQEEVHVVEDVGMAPSRTTETELTEFVYPALEDVTGSQQSSSSSSTTTKTCSTNTGFPMTRLDFVAHIEKFKTKEKQASSKITCTDESRGSKRVLPPLPDNNPFKIIKHVKQQSSSLELLKNPQLLELKSQEVIEADAGGGGGGSSTSLVLSSNNSDFTETGIHRLRVSLVPPLPANNVIARNQYKTMGTAKPGSIRRFFHKLPVRDEHSS